MDDGHQEAQENSESDREAAFGENGKIPKMPEDEWLTAGLGLLMLLAQAYYKLLEQAVSAEVASLDLDLNQSYLWTVKNIKNLLKNHEGLSDFPIAFEPPFPNLYPSTVRDVDWEDMIAPGAEHFLGTVQEYVHDKGFMPPEEKSGPWIFIELFRPSVMDAIEKAEAYSKQMRCHMQKLIERVERSQKVKHSADSQPAEPAVAEMESADGTTDDLPPTLVVGRPGEPCIVLGVEKKLTDGQRAIIVALQRAGDEGMKKDEIEAIRSSARRILSDLQKDPDWAKVILMPGKTNARYRLRQ